MTSSLAVQFMLGSGLGLVLFAMYGLSKSGRRSMVDAVVGMYPLQCDEP